MGRRLAALLVVHWRGFGAIACAAFAALSQLLGSNAEKARRLRRLAAAPPRRAGDWFAAPLRKFFDVVVPVSSIPARSRR